MSARPLVTHVKICGLRRGEDARLAAALGASAVGFVLWSRSPRAIAPDAARAIATSLPAFVTRVGVFVDEPPDRVREIVATVGLDVVQLHGEEPVEAYAAVGARLMKAVTLNGGEDVERAAALPDGVMPLVDAIDPERRGGTGQAADWTLAAALARRRPVVLAGGLTAANVAEAVRIVQPWAVDVSSGVEREPGVKDPDKMQAFFAALGATNTEGV